jgi:uncharacterized protein (TIGR00645 family)
MSDSESAFDATKNRLERVFEAGMFHSRWLIVPIYVGLVVALGALVLNFIRDTWLMLSQLFSLTLQETIVMTLTLIDVSLVGNLLLIVIFSGYENFVSKIDTEDHEDRPEWMGYIDFGGVKMKVIASIVAISAIALLKAFIGLSEGKPFDAKTLTWLVILHGTFVSSGLILAAMDLVSSRTRKMKGY